MASFNTVVIRNTTRQEGNVHLAVHPFYIPKLIHIYKANYYGSPFDDYDMPLWQRGLVDKLWETIPGLRQLFLGNGEITLQHSGAFDDYFIVEAATEAIHPFLEQNLALKELGK